MLQKSSLEEQLTHLTLTQTFLGWKVQYAEKEQEGLNAYVLPLHTYDCTAVVKEKVSHLKEPECAAWD